MPTCQTTLQKQSSLKTVNNMAEAIDTQAYEVAPLIPQQEKPNDADKRIAAFRAANLAVVALFEEGLSADSRQIIEANEYAEQVIAGRVRV